MSKHPPHRTSLVAAILCTMALATCSLRACSSDSAPGSAGDGDAGVDGEKDGKPGEGGIDAVAEDAGASDSLDSAFDSETWQPAGDPGWKPVEWAPDCGVQIATTPSNAVPSLVWADCGAEYPGCRRLVPNWAYSGVAYPLYGAQVFRQGTAVRLSLHMYFEQQWRKAIWDEDMKPLIAWRGLFWTDACESMLLQWTSSHVCFSLARAGSSLDALLPTTDPSSAPLKVFQGGAVPRSCNSSLWAGISLGGKPFVRDLSTEQGNFLSLPNAAGGGDLALSGNTAFFFFYGYGDAGEWSTGWSWKPPNTTQQIVDPGSELVYDIRSDGTTLAWVQTAATSIQDTAPGWLWTSPHSTDPAGVVPSKRRSVPPISAAHEMKGIGGGYYALVEQHEGQLKRVLHTYRLSDARHWQVPTPPDLNPAYPILVDAEEMWVFCGNEKDAPWTVIRQRLDALGAGD